MTRRLSRWGVTAVLTVIAICAVYPLIFMLIGSLKGSTEFLENPVSLPERWTNLENFQALDSRFDIGRLLVNTASYAGTALLITLALAVPMSFALAKLQFSGRRMVYGLIVASMGIPMVSILIPDYLIFVRLGLSDSPISLIGIWVVRALPGSVFLLTALLRALPTELLEAARVDGANYRQTMTGIVLPLAVPGLVTASIFNLTGWWNDVLVPIVFLQSDEKQTITASVATIGQRMAAQDYPLSMAALLVSSAAPILLYLVLQGHIRRGLVMGAVK